MSEPRKTTYEPIEKNIVKVVQPNRTARYRARYRDPSGKRQAKTFDSRKQAQGFLTKVNAAKLAGTFVDPKHGKILVKDFAGEWLAARDTRDSTQARDKSLVNRYIVGRFGDVLSVPFEGQT